MRIDAHQHFWRYNKEEYAWIGDHMPALKRDFLPAHLEGIFAATKLEGSVAVQARQSLEETRWLLQLADNHPLVKAVVGWVDLCSDAVEEQLAEFAAFATLAGVRHVVHDEPDDRFILGDAFMRGVGKLADFGLTFDILIFAGHLPVTLEFVKAFPDHRFVIDHMAKPPIADGILAPWKRHITEMASFPNVMCKVSGLVTEADWSKWRYEDFGPYLDTVFEAFGTGRVMFGSDWPVCTVAASYRQVMDVVQQWLDQNGLSPSEQDNFWGGNAAAFYRLDKK